MSQPTRARLIAELDRCRSDRADAGKNLVAQDRVILELKDRIKELEKQRAQALENHERSREQYGKLSNDFSSLWDEKRELLETINSQAHTIKHFETNQHHEVSRLADADKKIKELNDFNDAFVLSMVLMTKRLDELEKQLSYKVRDETDRLIRDIRNLKDELQKRPKSFEDLAKNTEQI